MDNYLGRRLDGRYKLTELIGTGGMARVYRATDEKTGATVAVKVLKEELLDNEELVRRFKNESKAIGLLDHENIVKVLDVNFSDSVQYIAMEYLAGITLKDYIEAHGVLTWKETVFFTEQVLRALQHAHDRGIIHRDIKPQNVMLLENGKVKVMDFGIARFSRSGPRTITDKAIGTVHYISPEQARGEETDARSDIYSVGVMMYEMATGKLPFDSDSAVSVALKQISDTAARPRSLNPDIPEGLEDIILRAMEKDAADRYLSAGSMLMDIEEFKKNPSISFEYKYLSSDTPTIYLDNTRLRARAHEDKDEVKEHKMAFWDKNKTKEKPAGAAKTKASGAKGKVVDFPIALLMGVTAACLVGALLLVVMTLNMSGSQLFANHADVELPDFVGKLLRDVQADSAYAQFNLEVVQDYNSEYEAGLIYAQTPTTPKTVKDNANVTLYVSKGTQIVTIPADIVGSTYGQAVTALQELGLVVSRETDNSDDYPGNTITKVEPASGTSVESGSSVTIYVNSPTTTLSTYVPLVTGMDFMTAKATLSANGLVVGAQTKVDDEAAAGTVLGQSIAEGVRVSNGTAVDLVISSGLFEQERTFTVAMPYADPNGNTSFRVDFYVGDTSIGSVNGASQASGASFTRKGLGDESIKVKVSGVDYAVVTANYQEGKVTVTQDLAAANGFTMSAPLAVSFSVNNSAYGSVSVNGSSASPVRVTAGSSCTVSISPAAGCTIASVTDNGADVTASAAGGSYTISNIQAAHAIAVTFASAATPTPTPTEAPTPTP